MSFVVSMDELLEGTKALQDVFEFDLPKMQKEKPETERHTTSSIL